MNNLDNILEGQWRSISFLLLFGILLLSICCTSCKKFVQIPNPPDQIIGSSVFSNDKTGISAIDGLYAQIMFSNGYLLNGGATLYGGLSSDELYNRISLIQDAQEFYNNSLESSNNTVNNNLWSAYKYIYQANTILEGLSSSTSLSSSLKKDLMGEARFTRALCYFYLVNLFGEIPLVLSTNYQVNAVQPRANISDVYAQIENDLIDAQNLLPIEYSSDNKTHPNKYAAMALLSRVYLYEQKWDSAITLSTSVISSGVYSLEMDLNNVFLINSKETIFELQPNSIFNSTYEGLEFVPTSSSTSITAYPLTTFLINSFEPGDIRFQDWIKKKEVSGITYYYAYKYKIRNSPDPANEYNVVLRLAEQYLIRAESYVRLGQIQKAQADLDIIRNRAGLLNTTTNTPSLLLQSILHERQVELFTEWGHRWLDMKRTGEADSVFGKEKAPYWNSYDTLYPIPQSQLKLNPFLTQNSGY